MLLLLLPRMKNPMVAHGYTTRATRTYKKKNGLYFSDDFASRSPVITESSHGRGCSFCAKTSLGDRVPHVMNCRSMKYFHDYIVF